MFLRPRSDDSAELTLTLSQIKKLYVALFRQLRDSAAADFDAFDEDDMLSTLQTYLQQQARAAGVDCTNHAEWDAFLGVAPRSCQRAASAEQPR